MIARIFFSIAASLAAGVLGAHASEAQSMKPNWSPDGESLIFYQRQPPSMLIKSISLSGGAVSSLTDDTVWLHSPKYSADGNDAYASGEVDGTPGMFKINLATGAVTRLAGINTRVMHPTPSPDGKWLAFDKMMSDGNFDLHLFDLVTGEVRQLVNTPQNSEFHPAWSADGSRILQDQRDGEKRHIIEVDVATGQTTVLHTSDNMMGMNHPVFGKDAGTVIFALKSGIYQIDAHGKHQHQLFASEAGWTVTAPAVSPDSSKIAFTEVTTNYSRGRIMVINSDNGSVQLIHDDGAVE